MTTEPTVLEPVWTEEERAEIMRLRIASYITGAANEIERLLARERHLLSVIRDYNPDDALFDHEKVAREAPA